MTAFWIAFGVTAWFAGLALALALAFRLSPEDKAMKRLKFRDEMPCTCSHDWKAGPWRKHHAEWCARTDISIGNRDLLS